MIANLEVSGYSRGLRADEALRMLTIPVYNLQVTVHTTFLERTMLESTKHINTYKIWNTPAP